MIKEEEKVEFMFQVMNASWVNKNEICFLYVGTVAVE